MNFILPTDIQWRSQTSYTAPCNGVVNHWAQIGGLRVFADHTRKNKCKTNASTFFACHAAFYACLSPCSDPSRCRWHMHLTNQSYFDYGKTPKTPNLSLMLGSKWPRFWDRLCIPVIPPQEWMWRHCVGCKDWNKQKIQGLFGPLVLKNLRALNFFFPRANFFFLISVIHQVLKWANIFKGHLGPW